MKKILIVLFLLPFTVLADVTNYVNISLDDNGDILVKEIINTSEDFSKDINYINSEVYNGGFNISEIHNGDNIKFISVKSYGSILNFDNLDSMLFFMNTKDYDLNKTDRGVEFFLVNENEKSFYIEYVISNLVVDYSDISEFYVNFDNTEIDNLEIIFDFEYINLFNNLKNNKLNFKNVKNIDLRVLFNNDDDSLKVIDVLAIDEIVKYQQNLTKLPLSKVMGIIFCYLWLFVLMYVLFNFYKKYDREYTNYLKKDFYKNIPAIYTPLEISYLHSGKINHNSYIADILSLIYANVIKFEKKGNSYLFSLSDEELTEGEVLLIDSLGLNEPKTLEEIKVNILDNESSFLSKYKLWKSFNEKDMLEHDFFENHHPEKYLVVCYLLVGFILSFIFKESIGILFNIIVLIAISSFIYVMLSVKRTKMADKEYSKYYGLRKFIMKFNNIHQEDLPDIHQWDKYLVYAQSLNVSNVFIKHMSDKSNQLHHTGVISVGVDFVYMYDFIEISKCLNKMFPSLIYLSFAKKS